MASASVRRYALAVHRGVTWYVAFLILTIGITWPLAGRLGTHIPGSEGDAFVHLWTFNWVKTALLTDKSVYFTDQLFYPGGVSLIQHNFAWFHIAVWLPLQAFLGDGTAYALIFLAGFAFTGVTTLYFVERLTGSTAAGFLAGVITAFWPYTLSHHNHPNLIFIGFVPLTLLMIDRLLSYPSKRHVYYLALATGMIGIVRWQQLVYAAPLLIGFWLWRWRTTRPAEFSWRRFWRDHRLHRTAAALGLAALIMLPVLVPFAFPFFSRTLSFSGLDAAETATGSTDLLAYLMPSRYHPLWGSWALAQTENFIINRVFTPFIGFTTLLLLGAAAVRRWQAVRFWVLISSILILVALGPTLTINGASLVPLPYRWFEGTLLAAVIRRPDRFNVMLSLPIAVTAAYGFLALETGLRGRQRPLLTIVLAALICFEYLTIYPVFPLKTPRWYQTLDDSKPAAVLDLPLHNRTYDEYYMFYQLDHGIPLVSGHVSRPPDDAFAFIRSVPLLAAMDFSTRPPENVPNVGGQLTRLAEAGVEHLVLHKQFLTDEMLRAWKAWLVINPIHEDDDLVVYATDFDLARDLDVYKGGLDRPLVAIEHQLSTAVIGQDSTLTVDVVWAAEKQAIRENSVCFALEQSGTTIETLGCQPISELVPPAAWASPEIMHGRYDLRISPFVSGGEFTLTATFPEEGTPADFKLPLGSLTVNTLERVFTAPDPKHPLELAWSNGVRLTGFDLADDALTLHWQAGRRIERRAVVFIHLVDRSSGEIVWQRDAGPRNWGYPMPWWETGEYVSEMIELPAGTSSNPSVKLFVGLYDLETQQRLAVRDAEGEEVKDGRVELIISN